MEVLDGARPTRWAGSIGSNGFKPRRNSNRTFAIIGPRKGERMKPAAALTSGSESSAR
jgi:hypothetical protein